MTLGTLDSHTHEDLSNVLSSFQSVSFILVVVGRGVLKSTTTRTEKFANHLIGRHIARDTFLQPVVVSQHRLVTDLVRRADLKQFRPFHDPDFDELFSIQQFINKFFPLLFIFVFHEPNILFDGWQDANNVKMCSSQEFFICTQPGRSNSELSQLVVDQSVNEIEFRSFRVNILLAFRQRDELAPDGVGFKPCHDERLTTLVSSHETFRRNGRCCVVVGKKHRKVRDIAVSSVRILSADRQLLSSVRSIQNSSRWIKLDGKNLRNLTDIVVSARLEPAKHCGVIFGVGTEAFSAGMRH